MARPGRLQPSSARARKAATDIVRTLRGAGHVAYFAGGCVRDELLGLEPTDYDVATDATPDQIRALFRRTAEVGAAFGVMLVRDGRVEVEVATFRSEGPYSDRRRPDRVSFADARADAQRRDFTINALFLDPLAQQSRDAVRRPARGVVIDYVGGLADLDRGLVRAVGDPALRLAEDHLRALRAVRLAARLGFKIEPATAEAISQHASELAGVSRERIGEELRRMFTHPSRAVAADLLSRLGLDRPVLGDHCDNGPRLLAALPPDASFPTALAAWALDRGGDRAITDRQGLVSAWRSALCLSNAERDDLFEILETVGRLRQWAGLTVAEKKRLCAQPAFPAALAIVHAEDRVASDLIRTDYEQLQRTRSGIAPLPLLTGDDLIALGLKPGPRFRQILDRVYNAQLEDRVRTRGEAMELARRLGV